ncbi:MAG: bifunctional YncE family protein/alkaline phosphatase family protein [Bacteroidota bacterium]
MTERSKSARQASLAAIIVAQLAFLTGCVPAPTRTLPGRLPDGRVRLPNGWFLSPAGLQVQVGELPLNMVVTPDERYVITTDNGTAAHSISVVDVSTWKRISTVPVAKAWVGLRLFDGGKRLLLSGGNDNRVDIYEFSGGDLHRVDSLIIAPPLPAASVWVAGIDIDEERGTVYAAGKENRSLNVIRLSDRKVLTSLTLPATPYTCLVSRRHPFTYVSLWGGAAVACVDRASHRIVRTIPVGDHPCDMLETPDGDRLFVANANTNTVSVIDLVSNRVTETISSALSPTLPYGSTPNGLAISPDGKTLYVANADNNYLAVMDVSRSGQSRAAGFIPTGWYPTCVKVLPSSGRIIVANGKGGQSMPNPGGPNPEAARRSMQYIGSLFTGSLSRIEPPDAQALAAYSRAVYENSRTTSPPPPPDESNPIPHRPGQSSPIKHVFYIIKENRTYDQVFGDMGRGNSDPALCLFGESVTPNHHALARQFVLLDNFYADAEVSADGHNWTMGAYATDYTEKTWPTSYGGRGGEYVYEGGTPIVYPSGGYLWDLCNRHGVTYRTYGEFARNAETPGDSARALLPSLEGHVAPHYRGWDLDYSDLQRVKDWEVEFERYEREGGLPQFQTIKLPNDHTEGTRRGKPTPRAYVAQNDLALGMIVDRISHSRYWASSAIFVIEDDAQNGPDHVDAHRTVALLISPYVRHGHIDSELYSTSSMVRTMELILGLPPLSQFDASATPMFASFTAKADLAPYDHRPARVDLEEKNPPGAYGQGRSELMDFSTQDAIPDIELSEIVWRSVRGGDSPMPAPVRSAFVRLRPDGRKDDE